jgi:hypothetical protein
VFESDFARLCAVTGAFFIFDNMIESETADPSECALFFHPSSMPVNLQSFLLGYVSAMAVFVEGFGSTLSVIQLQRSKMAVKRVEGGVTMVLVGRRNESDLAVRQHLDDVHSAFCFFYGSFTSLLASHSNSSRALLLKAMRRVGEELLPLIDNYCTTSFSSFDPLPFTSLRPHTGRVVLRASQLLQTVALPGHLGGAIFCSLPGSPGLCSLVATALPVDATRWVAARVTHVADSMALGGVGRGDDPLLNSQCDLLNVMVTTKLRDQLRSESSRAPPLIQPEEWCRAPPTSASTASSSSSLPSVLSGADLAVALTLPEPAEGCCYAGLLIVYVGALSAALLMELDQLYDQQHMQRVRQLCDVRLLALEQEMRALRCLPGGSSSNSDSIDSDTVLVMSPSSASGAALSATGVAASSSSGSVTAVAAASSDRGALSSSSPASLSHSNSLGDVVAQSPVFKSSTTPTSLRGRRSLPTDKATPVQHWVFSHEASTGWALASGTGSAASAIASQTELLNQANFVHDVFSKR